MNSLQITCKKCGWTGSPEDIAWDTVETCMGSDRIEICPECGSMEVAGSTVNTDIKK